MQMDNYSSKYGFSTSVWGPALWHFLHTISFNYPTKPSYEDKVFYYRFVTNLGKVLPCRACRENYALNLHDAGFALRQKGRSFRKFIAKHPSLVNRHVFSEFVYNLHEAVRKMQGKKTNVQYAELRDNYELFRASCKKRGKKSHGGCTEPLSKIRSECIVNIRPVTKNSDYKFIIDPRCRAVVQRHPLHKP
jgi:hypothetical protein